MEEGTRTKKTLFVGNIASDVDEAVLLETFQPFGTCLASLRRYFPLTPPGDIIEVQIPPASTNPNQQTGRCPAPFFLAER